MDGYDYNAGSDQNVTSYEKVGWDSTSDLGDNKRGILRRTASKLYEPIARYFRKVEKVIIDARRSIGKTLKERL